MRSVGISSMIAMKITAGAGNTRPARRSMSSTSVSSGRPRHRRDAPTRTSGTAVATGFGEAPAPISAAPQPPTSAPARRSARQRGRPDGAIRSPGRHRRPRPRSSTGQCQPVEGRLVAVRGEQRDEQCDGGTDAGRAEQAAALVGEGWKQRRTATDAHGEQQRQPDPVERSCPRSRPSARLPAISARARSRRRHR